MFHSGINVTREILELTKTDGGSWYAHGLAYNKMFQSHVEETNALPPNFIIESCPNQPFNSTTTNNAAEVVDYNYGALSKLLSEVKTLSTKVCAICGIDKKLQLCGRCKSVSYSSTRMVQRPVH